MHSLTFNLAVFAAFAAISALAVWNDLARHRGQEEIGVRDALNWTMVYVGAACLFGAALAFYEPASAGQFFSAYLLEKSLSVDNLIVWTAVFSYFGVASQFRNRILKYGILGAFLLRGPAVLLGLAAVGLFERAAEALFAALIFYSVWKMTSSEGGDDEVDHEKRWYIRWARALFRVDAHAEGTFFVRRTLGSPLVDPSSRLFATRFLLCLIAVEVTDVIFAGDSIPAIVGVTRDPAVAMSAMLFAMLGLRSMYFLLEAAKRYLTRLELAVQVLLGFVGLRMAVHAATGYEVVGPVAQVGVIVGFLALGVAASWLFPEAEDAAVAPEVPAGAAPRDRAA